MELLVVVFMLSCAAVYSKVHWIVSNKPVMYGDNITLTCKTGHVLTDRTECPLRQWYGGHTNQILLYNNYSLDASKYEDRTNLSSTEFSLVIKNYTESDLNINYSCACGFNSYTKRLALDNNNFIVPPLRVDTYIQQSNDTLSIYLDVERVYPCPECSIVIGERTVFDNLTFTSVKQGIFYNATYEASFNIVADVCGKKPTFLCYIENKYNIVNTSGELIQNCTEVRDDGVDAPGYIPTSTESYTTYITLVAVFAVAALACLLTATVIIYKRKSRRIPTLSYNTDDIINYDDDQVTVSLK